MAEKSDLEQHKIHETLHAPGINRVVVKGFRGLNIDVPLKRVNIIVGENGTGKTSFLEAVFLASLFQSNVHDSDLSAYIHFVLMGRGDVASAFMTIPDSEVVTDGTVVKFRRVGPFMLDVEVNGESIARMLLPAPSPDATTSSNYNLVLMVNGTEKKDAKYSPFFISPHFDFPGVLESVLNLTETRAKTSLEVRRDSYGRFVPYYDGLPVYVAGRGILKRELIRLAISFSNPLLIDEIEDSLHPGLVKEVVNDMKREKGVQILFTTNSNDVVRLSGKVFNDSEAQVIYLAKGGYRVYRLSEISEFEKPLSWMGYV